EQVAVFAVGLLEAVAYQADDDVVGYQAAAIHDFFGFQAQRCLGLDGSTQHIPRGNLGNAEFLSDECRLGSFASAGWTEQNQSHEFLLELRVFLTISDYAAMQQSLHAMEPESAQLK